MDEREMFEAAMADECPEFQRNSYTASDVESNVRAVAWSIWQAARRTTPDRDAGLEDAAVLMEQRAAEIEACDNLTAHTMARIYRDEGEKIRALKTTPTAASREES
ncbi:hypothetical protein WT25_11215 [Burkholderia territorii]|uniref:hypothetical protein n=1 Tax=Burkholderia territorii TaxID=1503055 RepID=UPI00075415CD|nr:hypothetical protein [Burkholderia territorii]KVT86315.1 hypothetical protein WT25_11215 [Burkholderia territorii]